jgi:NAD(P)-dependent dehydrogenase (short-subunit alcohol dehydrogenase family)
MDVTDRGEMRLEGKAAIITGAGRGLGRAIAFAMAGEGSRLTIMSRSLNELEAVASQIEKRGGVSHIFQGDVSRNDDVSRMVDETIELYSTIDILVNNAAIIGPARFLEDTDFDAWDETINVNLNGPFYCARSVIPTMINKGSGKIINISSGLGQMPFPRFSAYGVSKAGIIQLTRSLSEELKEQNIQVNAIDPGVMDTDMQEGIRKLGPPVLGDALHRNFCEYKKSGSLKDPDEVASLAVFLASSSSDHLSGYISTLRDYARLGWKAEN